MATYEDGSYSCNPGIELIAKVLAGRCQMNYTRVAVGKGNIPDYATPKTMTEPADYVMDAEILSVTNPKDGECQVTVQINSTKVETGFYATGILLYAADPDVGEVPYTYLVLENGPEWIRPASSVVGKLATFDLIAAVGDVDKVTAEISIESIATREVVEQLIAESEERTQAKLDAKANTADVEAALNTKADATAVTELEGAVQTVSETVDKVAANVDGKADKTVATAETDGLMSAADKAKLDALEVLASGEEVGY